MGSRLGILKIAAKRIGIDFEEYIRLTESGLSHCTACKGWKLLTEFGKDSSRGNGYSSTCCACREKSPITKSARRINLTNGLKWCKGCSAWIPANLIVNKKGSCKACIAKNARHRYATDPNYRHERQQHAIKRKRGVDAVPIIGAERLLENFNGQCAYCPDVATTWDHIVPVKGGGQTVPGNIVPCCNSCNSSKKDQNLEAWMNKKGVKPHPELFDILILSETAYH